MKKLFFVFAFLAFACGSDDDNNNEETSFVLVGTWAGTWVVGFYATRFQNRKWFPATPSQMQRAEKFYRKYGRYSLLLSWVPFIGDPITVIAGVLREPIFSFLLLVTIAKSARYIALSLIVLEMI